jgi:hypothetical protein
MAAAFAAGFAVAYSPYLFRATAAYAADLAVRGAARLVASGAGMVADAVWGGGRDTAPEEHEQQTTQQDSDGEEEPCKVVVFVYNPVSPLPSSSTRLDLSPVEEEEEEEEGGGGLDTRALIATCPLLRDAPDRIVVEEMGLDLDIEEEEADTASAASGDSVWSWTVED